MSKDDYEVLVCKILVYLYRRLEKIGGTPDPAEYLQPNTKDFPIDKDYFDYVIVHMHDKGLIENVRITNLFGGEKLIYFDESIQISPDGIEYLRSNSLMRKLAESLPLAASIASLFTI